VQEIVPCLQLEHVRERLFTTLRVNPHTLQVL
jgi:hypothetical protein